MTMQTVAEAFQTIQDVLVKDVPDYFKEIKHLEGPELLSGRAWEYTDKTLRYWSPGQEEDAMSDEFCYAIYRGKECTLVTARREGQSRHHPPRAGT